MDIQEAVLEFLAILPQPIQIWIALESLCRQTMRMPDAPLAARLATQTHRLSACIDAESANEEANPET